MPFRFKDSVKNFRWQLDQESSLPVATIEKIGNGNYVMTCNLCGCGHNLLANQPIIGVYEPACANGDHQSLWANYRREWIRKYPEAANHRTIMLRAVESIQPIQEAIEATEPPLNIVTRRTRKKAAA